MNWNKNTKLPNYNWKTLASKMSLKTYQQHEILNISKS